MALNIPYQNYARAQIHVANDTSVLVKASQF